MSGTEVGTGWITLLPSLRGFDTAVGAQVTKSSAAAGEKAGGLFGRAYERAAIGPIRTFGEAAAGIFATEKVFEFLKGSVEVAREAQKLNQETAQAIKSTGGAANVTSEHVEKLSNSISQNTGVSKLAVQSGARLLLTFTNIRDQVGKGNAVFDRATRAVNNVAAAMSGSGSSGGGDSVRGAAIQVGKALNDPVRGLTTLTRVGVTFSDQQRAQITRMVQSGHLLGAQKVLLHELGIEFGGAAKASTTMGQKVSVAFENMREKIGNALLPAIDNVEGKLIGLFPRLEAGAKSVEHFFGAIADNATVRASVASIGNAIGRVGDAAKTAASASVPFVKILTEMAGASILASLRALSVSLDGAATTVDALTHFFTGNRVAAVALSVAVGASVVPALARMTAAFGMLVKARIDLFLTNLVGTLGEMAGAFMNAGMGVRGMGAALGLLDLNPLGLALTAIGGAIAGIAIGLHEFAGGTKAAAISTGDFTTAIDEISTGVPASTTALGQLKTQIASLSVVGEGLGYVSGNLKNLDAALTSLVTSGHANQASKAFNQVERSLIASGMPLNTLIGLFPRYKSAVSSSAAEAKASKTGIDSYGNAMDAAAQATQRATAAAQRYTDKLHALLDPVFAYNQALQDLKAKQDAASKAIDKYGANSGKAKQANLDLAQSALNVEASGAALRSQVDKNSVAFLQANGRIKQFADQSLITKRSADSVIGSFNHLATSADKLGPAVQKSGNDVVQSGKKLSSGFIGATHPLELHLKSFPNIAGVAGTNMMTQFGSSIGGGKSRVTGAASAVLKAVAGALGKTGGVSTEGADLIRGFAAGMTSGGALGAVASAAAGAIAYALDRLHHHGDGGSPYKAFMPEGEWAIEGFALGWARGEKVVDLVTYRTLKHLEANVTGGLKHLEANSTNIMQRLSGEVAKLPKDMRDSMGEWVDAFTKQVNETGRQFDHLTQRFQTTEQAAKSYASGIRQALTQNAGLSNIDITGGGGAATLTAESGRQLSSLKRFLAGLDKLKRKGLDQQLLTQILNMGPTAGLPYEQALLADPSSIKRLDRQQRAITRISGKFAETAATDKYGATLDRQLTELKEIRKEIRNEHAAVASLAEEFARELHHVASVAKRKNHAQKAS